ncbi:MAG TPA: VOC family protein [Thermoanaerobaculia bacterium]|nr:VOC family protein [Thermoanaerobaculia bacterium]
MLTTAPVTTILPVIDAERARNFYERTLGLRYIGISGDGKHLFSIASGTLALLPKAEGTKAEHTALSFEVADTTEAVDTLTSRGVLFEDYDYPGLTTVNKVCILGSEKAAWFKDTEGNILCVHQVLR